MLKLFHQDNARFEWLKQQLNLTDYKLKDVQPYKRETRYERFLRETREKNEHKRAMKLKDLKDEFDKQKEEFFKEKERVLLEIQKEVRELGFDLKFPQLDNKQQ